MNTEERGIIAFSSGAVALSLIHHLVKATQELLEYKERNELRPPEMILRSVPAYKVTIIQQLIFTGTVNARELSGQLEKKGSCRRVDTVNYEMACAEIHALVQDLNRRQF